MDIKVPAMGESVTEGTLANWLVKPGQAVKQDDPIAEIETDKVAVEVPAPAAGVISEQLVKEGETVKIGTIIARLKEGAAASAAPSAKPAASAAAPAAAKATASASAGPRAADKAAPSVTRIAAEAGVRAADIPGTGKGGRATKADAMKYVASAASAPAPAAARAPAPELPHTPRELGPREERVKMTRLRQTIARRLKDAQNTAAMLTTFNDVDMSEVMELRKRHKDAFEKKHGVKLGFMGFFTRACVAALKEIPSVNGEIDGTDIIYKNYYNIGVAVGTDKGLVVPVVRDADTMTLAEVEAEIARLGGLARDGKLSMDDLQGGTFTISNGGVYGSLMSTPILNPPQSGVLGMHRIEERPVVVDGKIVARPMMYLALSYDHRLVDGKEAVTFLVRIKEALEDPERLLLDL
jgi:2-oxoglutarate dehydrogenase E2 component (dihydrolipoamide succinyltransferase)